MGKTTKELIGVICWFQASEKCATEVDDIWFGFDDKWHINLWKLFNVKAIFVEPGRFNPSLGG